MTTEQLAKILRVSQRTVSVRCLEMGIPKVLKDGRWKYYLTQEQVNTVAKIKPKEKKKTFEIVDFIRIETTYYIHESKLNYLEI